MYKYLPLFAAIITLAFSSVGNANPGSFWGLVNQAKDGPKDSELWQEAENWLKGDLTLNIDFVPAGEQASARELMLRFNPEFYNHVFGVDYAIAHTAPPDQPVPRLLNLPARLLAWLPANLLRQETVQTFSGTYIRRPSDSQNGANFPETLQDARNAKGDAYALALLFRLCYEKATNPPDYRTSYRVNGEETAHTEENFRYSHQPGYTGNENSLRETQGFRERFAKCIVLAEEGPFLHNGIGPGSVTNHFRSNDPNNPVDESLLDMDFNDLPPEVQFQTITTRWRSGLVLDGGRALNIVALMTATVLMTYYFPWSPF
jgi:hypothetical protein